MNLQRALAILLLAVFAPVHLALAAADPVPPQKGQVYVIPAIQFMGSDSDRDLNSYMGYGLGLGGYITDRFSMELMFGIGETEFDGPSSADADIRTYRLDGRYDLGDGRWRPYVVGGVGLADFDFGGGPAGNNSSDTTQVNLGLGVERLLTDRLRFHVDARGFYSNDSDEVAPAMQLGLRYVLAGPVEPRDADGDGVADGRDQCPGTPRGTPVDRTGCPMDSDGDGVVDGRDACPDTPAGVSVDSRGCALDSDRDGVADYRDECPDTPRGDVVDQRGCTVEQEEPVSARIELKLEFDFDSSDLRSNHYGEIDRVARFMREHPDTRAQLEGHTDSKGSDAYNQALSERRAYSVRDYLIDNADIDPRRITAAGRGERQPVASNETDEGRQRNRRVEAVIDDGEMSVRPR